MPSIAFRGSPEPVTRRCSSYSSDFDTDTDSITGADIDSNSNSRADIDSNSNSYSYCESYGYTDAGSDFWKSGHDTRSRRNDEPQFHGDSLYG